MTKFGFAGASGVAVFAALLAGTAFPGALMAQDREADAERAEGLAELRENRERFRQPSQARA